MAGATHVLPRVMPRPALLRRRAVRRAATFYLLVSPWLLGFVLLSAVPLAGALLMSLTNYDGLNLDYVAFVGVDNYARAFSDPEAQHALLRTLLLMVLVVPPGLVLQLLPRSGAPPGAGWSSSSPVCRASLPSTARPR
ncbi:MAG: sugar ABC transporter permease [Chloroflexi bacterium]|nr:MAG: sugar ABC transporter permease [Chloroflexota bacterium]